LDIDKLRSTKYVDTATFVEVAEYLGPDEQRKADHGTTIRLMGLNLSKRPSPSVFGRSMARRFLLHQRSYDFKVLVNGESIPRTEDVERIEFVFPKDYGANELPDGTRLDEEEWGIDPLPEGKGQVRWRFLFYEKPIDEEELRGIAIFANGKLVQTPF